VFAFQNCSKSYVVAQAERSAGLSKAKIKSEAIGMKWSNQDLRCDDFSSYVCERNIFSPDVETMTHALKECLPGDTICVDVEIRQFNTSAESREEVRCQHRWLYQGVTIFEGDRDTIEESLSEAMAACERAL